MASPSSSPTVGSELELVKAALLYGDKVTVISPSTTMLLRAENIRTLPLAKQLELVRRVAPALLPPEQIPEFERSIAQVDEIMRRVSVDNGRAGRLQSAAIKQVFQPYVDDITHAIEEIRSSTGVDQLSRARGLGLVSIEHVDLGDELDLIASCIVSAQFRAAMVTTARSFASKPWESDFHDEVESAWVETVHPAIQTIEASVRDNRSLLDLAACVTSAANTALPGLAILAAGLVGHADALAARVPARSVIQ